MNIQLNEDLFKKITPREREILTHIAAGLSTKEIGVKVGLSANTVEVHRHNMLKRTGYRNSVELVAASIKGGII